MFMNEVPGEYSPGGWMTCYPEFLPERRILTCPSTEPGVMSYRMTWPTANEQEFRQLHRDLTGGDDPRFQAYVPMVVEVNECGASGGRNVLFLDGHVEYIQGRLEDEPRIAPFLNLK
jgi:prepilin-type processing-associated H-X9-DG protein